MGSYAKGDQTRAALLDAARELFYERGYVATRLDQIAEHANANPGLIHYYFKTKANIALEIYEQFLTSSISSVAELFGEEPTMLRRALEIRVLWMAISSDDRFASFMGQISADGIPLEMSQGTWEGYMSESMRDFSEGSDARNALVVRCSAAAECELIRSFASGSCPFLLEELIRIDVLSLFGYFLVPSDCANAAIERSGELAGGLDVGVDSRMRLHVRKR